MVSVNWSSSLEPPTSITAWTYVIIMQISIASKTVILELFLEYGGPWGLLPFSACDVYSCDEYAERHLKTFLVASYMDINVASPGILRRRIPAWKPPIYTVFFFVVRSRSTGVTVWNARGLNVVIAFNEFDQGQIPLRYLARSWSLTSFERVCDQLRTSFEPASVMEFGFYGYAAIRGPCPPIRTPQQ